MLFHYAIFMLNYWKAVKLGKHGEKYLYQIIESGSHFLY
jgi:hypothetical protein